MTSKFNRWFAAAGSLAMACSVYAQGKVTNVSTVQVDGGLAVKISGSDLQKPTTRWDDGAIVLRFAAELNGKAKVLKPNDGGIKAISYGSSKGSVDVAIRPSKRKQPQIFKHEDGWMVLFEEDLPTQVGAYDQPKPKAQPAAQQFAPVNPRDTKNYARVSLNFVNTEIAQILKALAIQANVNIAMGPDVVGKVTVNLDNVTVKEALDLVTTLGGVRYAESGNTYIVASPAKFSETMGSMGGWSHAVSATRVVPLFSRDGTQVKASILKSIPPNTPDGKYELVLPSEKVSVEQKTSLNPGDDKAAANGAAGNESKVETKTSDEKQPKDDYVVLIGTPARLDAVELAIRGLDQQICFAMGIKIGGNSTGIMRRTYEPKGILASELVKTLAGDKKEFNGVQLAATPASSVSRQTIVLTGRETEVDRVYSMLQELDTVQDGAETQYEMVGLKFIKPNFAKIQLMQNVPGLRASFLPPPVDPSVGIDYEETASQTASGDQGNSTTGGSTTAGSSGGEQGNSTAGQLGSNGNAGGGTVRTSTKSNSVPMKLLLRGTPGQIDAAKRYLAMVDLAPKQVAVELRVMELTRDEALRVGLDWSILTGGTLQSIRVNQGLSGADVPGGVGANLGFRGGGTASIVGALDQISTRNNVLARPSILVNDGVPTNIFVGDEVRYVKAITSSQNGPTVITDQVDVGVDFNVIARVGENGNIILDLGPTLKVLQGFTSVPGGGQLPQTSRRSASTQMTIRSGETIAIGGLIQDQDRKEYGGIPILKDLPIIGRLFGRTSNRRLRQEIVFFVTVREVTEADRGGTANPRQQERNNNDWPGNKDGKKGG